MKNAMGATLRMALSESLQVSVILNGMAAKSNKLAAKQGGSTESAFANDAGWTVTGE